MLDDLNKKLALGKLLEKSKKKGLSYETIQDVESATNNIEKACRDATDGDMGFAQLAEAWRFFDEKPPPPPYDHVRFDDIKEADNFCARVLEFHGLPLLSEKIPGGKLIRVIPAPQK